MKITNTQVEIALSHVDDPDLKQSLTQLGMIQNIVTGENSVAFDLVLTTPACPMKDNSNLTIEEQKQWLKERFEEATN